ncbi:unnamed protein product [Lampetra fluviatilis]
MLRNLLPASCSLLTSSRPTFRSFDDGPARLPISSRPRPAARDEQRTAKKKSAIDRRLAESKQIGGSCPNERGGGAHLPLFTAPRQRLKLRRVPLERG